ncbi:YicC/YloC family endoribonuclease [Balneola sp. MJW-20]|uniref:YicC/YloC family endoribonuclease n=1 Tax=Gracilimonas aurantiaca TaxID=3234185 RepID=UPI003465BD23
MILSMTGFGRGDATDNGTTATVEIKSLNSRYMDVNIRLPQQLQDKELQVKEAILDRVNRGKLNVSVHVTEVGSEDLDISVNIPKVRGYMKLLKEVQVNAGIEEPISVKDLTQFGDIFINEEEDEEETERKWMLVKKATQSALDNLINMRRQEGTQLQNDLEDRIRTISDNLEVIEKDTEGKGEEIRAKLRERIAQIIEEDKIDEDRLEMEIAVLVDKMDITEEIVRLKSHLKFFLDAMQKKEPSGRRLNFLTQEINRELNTIGSKANNSDVAQNVVASKEALEQIREQVQNVE